MDSRTVILALCVVNKLSVCRCPGILIQLVNVNSSSCGSFCLDGNGLQLFPVFCREYIGHGNLILACNAVHLLLRQIIILADQIVDTFFSKVKFKGLRIFNCLVIIRKIEIPGTVNTPVIMIRKQFICCAPAVLYDPRTVCRRLMSSTEMIPGIIVIISNNGDGMACPNRLICILCIRFLIHICLSKLCISCIVGMIRHGHCPARHQLLLDFLCTLLVIVIMTFLVIPCRICQQPGIL